MKKLNNQGMTLVELIVTFAIVMILVIGMLSVIISLKNDMNESSLNKELLEYKDTITYVINNDLIKSKANNIEQCTFNVTGDKGYCYKISFENNSTKNLEINLTKKYIKYDGIKYEIPESSIMEFRDSLIYASDNINEKIDINKDENNFINIYIPFYIIDEEENYGIDIIHPINIEFDLGYDMEFLYTGDYQEYKVPVDGYYYIEANGAQGNSSTTGDGGLGGFTSGYIYLNEGEKLYIYVGARGNTFNGGGETTFSEHGGGGSTDIRYFKDTVSTSTDLAWNSTLGLNSRVMVAAGGGGNSSLMNGSKGGYAGGLIGGNGTSHSSVGSTYNGYGANQTIGGVENSNGGSAGVFGIGGSSGIYTDGHVGGSGGGGYYGGSGAKWHAGAGGGSSFISGYAGSNAITSSSNRTHTNNTLHYSSKYFIDGNMVSGYNSGNGRAIISYVGKTLKRTNDKLNNVRYIKDCINGNSANDYNEWRELQAIVDGKNVALNKTITGTGTVSKDWGTGTYASIIDGSLDAYTSVLPTSNGACITIDLGTMYDLDEIAVWHSLNIGRSYNNHSLSVSSDNSNWKTIIDNESGVIETSEGKRVSAYNNSYTLTNLVKNGSFENGTTNWTITNSSYSTISNSQSFYGNQSLKTSSSSITSSWADQRVSTPVGHIFYYRVNFSIDTIYSGGLLNEAKAGDDSTHQGNFNLSAYYATTPGFISLSKRGSSLYDTTIIRLGIYQSAVVGYQDGILLVDLTEAFGSGNEPSKEWCDKYIRYFDGTMKISASILE